MDAADELVHAVCDDDFVEEGRAYLLEGLVISMLPCQRGQGETELTFETPAIAQRSG